MTTKADACPIPLKIYVPSRGFQIGLAATSLSHLRSILEAKLGLTERYKLTLEDGTIVCDPEYFKLLERQTKITVVLASPRPPGAITNEQRKRTSPSVPSPAKRVRTSPAENNACVDLNTNQNNSQLLSNICISSVAGNVPMSPPPTSITSPPSCSPQLQQPCPPNVGLISWCTNPSAPVMQPAAPQPFLQQPCQPVHVTSPVYRVPQGPAPFNQAFSVPRPPAPPNHVQWISRPRFIQPHPHEVIHRQQQFQQPPLNHQRQRYLNHDQDKILQYQMQMQFEQNMRATISMTPPPNGHFRAPQPVIQPSPINLQPVQRPTPVQQQINVHPMQADSVAMLNPASMQPIVQQPLFQSSSIESGPVNGQESTHLQQPVLGQQSLVRSPEPVCVQQPKPATVQQTSVIAEQKPVPQSRVVTVQKRVQTPPVQPPISSHITQAGPFSIQKFVPSSVKENLVQSPVAVKPSCPTVQQIPMQSSPVAVDSPFPIPSSPVKSVQTSAQSQVTLQRQPVTAKQPLTSFMQPPLSPPVPRSPAPYTNQPSLLQQVSPPQICIPDGTHKVNIVKQTPKSPPMLLKVVSTSFPDTGAADTVTDEGDSENELCIVESEESLAQSPPLPRSSHSSPSPSHSPKVASLRAKLHKPDKLNLSQMDDGYCSATTSSLGSADDVRKALPFANFDDFIPLHSCYNEDKEIMEDNEEDLPLAAPEDNGTSSTDTPENNSTDSVNENTTPTPEQDTATIEAVHEEDEVDSLVVALPIRVIDGQIYYNQHAEVRDKIMVKSEFAVEDGEVIIIDMESEDYDSDVGVMNHVLNNSKRDFNLSLNEDNSSEAEDHSANVTVFMSDNENDIANEVIVAEHGAEVPVVTTPLDSKTPLINIDQCVADIIRVAQHGGLKIGNNVCDSSTTVFPSGTTHASGRTEIIEESVLLESSDLPQADSELVMGNEIIISTEGSSQMHMIDDLDNSKFISNLLLHSC